MILSDAATRLLQQMRDGQQFTRAGAGFRVGDKAAPKSTVEKCIRDGLVASAGWKTPRGYQLTKLGEKHTRGPGEPTFEEWVAEMKAPVIRSGK